MSRRGLLKGSRRKALRDHYCVKHGGVFYQGDCAECRAQGKVKQYVVHMVGVATVKGSITVNAASVGEAVDHAAELTGDVSWVYQGLEKVEDITPVEVKGVTVR